MSSTTLPVCPKTGSTSPSLTVHLCLHTALLREIGNAPDPEMGLQRALGQVGATVEVVVGVLDAELLTPLSPTTETTEPTVEWLFTNRRDSSPTKSDTRE